MTWAHWLKHGGHHRKGILSVTMSLTRCVPTAWAVGKRELADSTHLPVSVCARPNALMSAPHYGLWATPHNSGPRL